MSVQNGGRYSFLTVWLITPLVMIVNPKGKTASVLLLSNYFSAAQVASLSIKWMRFSFCPSICERVTPRLSHANSAVVLSAVKVLMKFMEMLPKDLDYYGTLLKKLAPPLVTLLSAEPELQYVALRNINLIVQRR